MPPALQRLRRLLGVEPGEGRVVLWAAASLFLLEWASVSVSNASDTLFLKRVGIGYLPLVFFINSLLLTATTLAAGRLVTRLDQRRLLASTFAALSVVLAVLWVLVLVAAPGIATTLMLASKQIDVIAGLMFWTVVTALLTSRQGKRLVALMTAGGTLGTICGSFASGPLGRLVGIPALLAIAATMFAVAALASVPLTRSAPPRLVRAGLREAPEPGARLLSFWRESSLFRILAATSFLAGVLGPMLYFDFSFAADLATRTADGEQRLLDLYGLLRGWINVGVLVVQVGVSAALFRRIGVPLAATLAPAAYLVGFTGLSLRFGLPTAMPATMGTSVLDHTIYEPAQRILVALMPPRIRKAATSVVQGPAKRAGAALGSLLTLAVVALGDPSLVATTALPIAAVWLMLALWLWRDYPNFLLEAASVRTSDGEGEGPVVVFLDAPTLATLRRNLEGEDAGLCRAAAALFADAPRPLAVDALAGALPAAPPVNRAIVIETLDHVLADPDAIRQAGAGLATNLLRALTASAGLDAFGRACLLHALGRVFEHRETTPAIAALLEQACGDASPAVRVAARIGCRRASVAGVPCDFDETVGEALASADSDAHAVAIAELRIELLASPEPGEGRSRRVALLVAEVEGHGAAAAPALDSFVLRRAIDALADLATVDADVAAASLAAVVGRVDHLDPTVRAAVLRFLGNAGSAEHAALLAARVSSRDAVEAEAARAAIGRLGPRAADALLRALRHGGRRAREVIPALLGELSLDADVLYPVIAREIDANRGLQVLVGALEASAVSRLLVQRLRERIDESMHAVLEMLSALHGEPRIASVSRCLGRAWNLRDRAVLLEALEALLPAAERARILPLLEDGSAQRVAAEAASALGRRWPSTEEALAEAVASGDALTTALVAATVNPVLVARAVPGLDLEASQRLLSGGAEGPSAASKTGDSAAAKETRMLSPVEKMLHLRSLDLFEGLTTLQLSELARVVAEEEVPGGRDIVAEGDFDDRMYFIVSGRVRITKGGRKVAELGPRDFFGEMSVFDGETRSATATADGDVKLLRLARGDLFEVMEDQPAIGIGISQTLVKRLRGMLEERSSSQPPKA